jgi:hypothetical protein
MSKSGRGILRGPGPYSCLYSPKGLELDFSHFEGKGRVRSSPIRS